jgi:hypothetical protein
MQPDSQELGCFTKTVTLMNRTEALATASKYGLEGEVAYAIDVLNYSPIEALAEWDIL